MPLLVLKLEVFFRRWELDQRLALGERPDRDPALAMRARQLTSRASRRSLARSLRRSQRLAGEPLRWGASTPLDRDAVAAAAPLLKGIALRLTDPLPVSVRGVALISELVKDGGSPLYESGWTGRRPGAALANRLRSAGSALEIVV